MLSASRPTPIRPKVDPNTFVNACMLPIYDFVLLEFVSEFREKALAQLSNDKATVTVDDSDRDRRAAAVAWKVAIQQILKKQAMAKAQESGKDGTADIKSKAEVASKALDSAFGAISDGRNRSAKQLMNEVSNDVDRNLILTCST